MGLGTEMSPPEMRNFCPVKNKRRVSENQPRAEHPARRKKYEGDQTDEGTCQRRPGRKTTTTAGNP
jgi:hypothetical protein